MKIALSAIKADIDSVGGHICPRRLLNVNLRIQSRLMEGIKILVEIPYKEQRSDSKEKRIDH